MLTNKLLGTGVALITPFKSDGTVDYEALEQIVDHVIDGGVDYVVALGTTSEAPTLTSFERDAVVKSITRRVKQRVPVIVGVGGNCTAEWVKSLKTSDFTGVNGILSVVPYYNKPTQEGMFQHFRAIAKASPVPVILYNIPSRCGVNMTAETTLRLADACSNIVGIKEASGDMAQVKAIIAKKPEHFQVISGDDSMALSIVEAGGAGVISVLANALPNSVSTMVKEALADHPRKAKKLHTELEELMKLLFVEGNPTGVKAMMSILGLCKNRLRLPLVPSSEDLFSQLQTAMTPFKSTSK